MTIHITLEALLIMIVQSHLHNNEIIGYLGGYINVSEEEDHTKQSENFHFRFSYHVSLSMLSIRRHSLRLKKDC